MRRFVPSLLLGLLTIGVVAAMVGALGNSTPSGTPSASATTTPTTNVTLHTPVLAPAVTDHTPACALVTPAEAKRILNQIVNNPGTASPVYCGYGGLVAVAPAQRAPSLTVTVVVNPASVRSTQALIRSGFPVDCGALPKGESCSSVARQNHRDSVDGVNVIWDQTTSVDDAEVGAAIAAKDGRAIIVAVTGTGNAGRQALSALTLALSRV